MKTIKEKAEEYDRLKALVMKCSIDKYGCIIGIKPSDMFSELAESEDERIRKQLIAVVELYYGETDEQEKKDCLSWLEKKSEQKSVEDIAKEVIKDKESAVQFLKSAGIMDSNGELAKEYRDEQNLVESTDDLAPILQGYIPTIMNKHGMPEIEADAITETAYYFYSLGAKKRSEDKRPKELEWSKDDEKTFSRISEIIHSAAYQNYDVDEDGEEQGEYAKIMGWFKSLKERIQPQSQWKPSKEQIISLRWVLNHIPYDSHKEEISGLLEQLKKLKEE